LGKQRSQHLRIGSRNWQQAGGFSLAPVDSEPARHLGCARRTNRRDSRRKRQFYFITANVITDVELIRLLHGKNLPGGLKDVLGIAQFRRARWWRRGAIRARNPAWCGQLAPKADAGRPARERFCPE